MKIAIASPDTVPALSPGVTGQFADGLCKALVSAKHEIALFTPKYRSRVKTGAKKIISDLPVSANNRTELVSVETLKVPKGPKIFQIGHKGYFDRKGVFGENDAEYSDNAERFILYSRAVLESMKAVLFQPDLIIAVGWAPGLLPVYLKTLYAGDGFFYRTKSAFLVVDYLNTGSFEASKFGLTGLPWSEFTFDKMEFYGNLSFLKAGLVYSDIVLLENSLILEKAKTDSEFTKGLKDVFFLSEKKLVPLNTAVPGEPFVFSWARAVREIAKSVRPAGER